MLRVQTFEKKLELQQIKEQRVTAMVDQSAEEFEQVKQERDTYFTLVGQRIIDEKPAKNASMFSSGQEEGRRTERNQPANGGRRRENQSVGRRSAEFEE